MCTTSYRSHWNRHRPSHLAKALPSLGRHIERWPLVDALAFQDLFGRGFPRRLPEGRIQETSANRDPSESGLRFHRTDTAPAHVAQTQRPCRTTRPGMRTPVCFVAGNDAPLIDELAATRGRGAMEGGDEHAGAKRSISRAPASQSPGRTVGISTSRRPLDQRSADAETDRPVPIYPIFGARASCDTVIAGMQEVTHTGTSHPATSLSRSRPGWDTRQNCKYTETNDEIATD